MASEAEHKRYEKYTREQLVNALVHVADELKGQVIHGSLSHLDNDAKRYWLQVAECAVDPEFLSGNNPNDIELRKQRDAEKQVQTKFEEGDRVIRRENVYDPRSPLMHGTVVEIYESWGLGGYHSEVYKVRWDGSTEIREGYLPHGLHLEGVNVPVLSGEATLQHE